MKKNRILIILAIVVIGAGLAGLCACVVLPVLLGPAVEETLTGIVDSMTTANGEEFIQALADEDYAAAYDLCTKDLQAEIGSSEQLAAMFRSMPDITSWHYDTRTMEVDEKGEEYTKTTTVVVLEGEVTFSDGESDPLEIVLHPELSGSLEEGMPYRVAGFHIGSAR
jgi:hypothetical protein